MENEVWRDIEGYEGIYQVSNKGRVKSLQRLQKYKCRNPRMLPERIMSVRKDKLGYGRVGLYNGEYKFWLIHRLVAITFLPNPNNLPVINHKDENPSNNRVENLEWCTRKYNNNYGTASARMAKTLREKDNPINHVVQYTKDGVFVAEYISVMEAHRQTRFSSTSIFNACAGSQKTCHGFVWKFKNKPKRFDGKRPIINNSNNAAKAQNANSK